MLRGARVAIGLAGLLGLAACGSSNDTPQSVPPKVVTFKNDVAPIFVGCALCHHAGNSSGVDFAHPFDPATGIINRPNTWTMARAKLIVEPGNVANSFLIDKVERADLDLHVEGNPMPWNIPALDATEIATIRQWIQDGAKDDDVLANSVAPIFGDGVSPGTRGGKCAYCHYPGTIQPPDLTHPFDPMNGIVNVSGARGVRVVPNDPAGSVLVKKIEGQTGVGFSMPYQQPRLDASQIATLKAWIMGGAKND
jgi:hypothetical protein